MSDKITIDGLDGFRKLVGSTIGPSEPIEVTQDRIAAFCHAVENDEWTHFDEERCKQAGFGTTIAPGMLTQAYFPKLWFGLVDIRNVSRMLIVGSDRVRLIAPLKRGQRFTMSATVARVEERDNALGVFLDLAWTVVGETKPVAVATYVMRYNA
jgi:acyl dehydratase